MLTERPKQQRVYLTGRDPDTGKSKSVTMYGVTLDEAIERAIQGRPSTAAIGNQPVGVGDVRDPMARAS